MFPETRRCLTTKIVKDFVRKAGTKSKTLLECTSVFKETTILLIEFLKNSITDFIFHVILSWLKYITFLVLGCREREKQKVSDIFQPFSSIFTRFTDNDRPSLQVNPFSKSVKKGDL